MPIWTINGPVGNKKGPIRELHLSYHNGEHYSSIRPIGDRTNAPTNIFTMNNENSSDNNNKNKIRPKPNNYASNYNNNNNNHNIANNNSYYMNNNNYEYAESDGGLASASNDFEFNDKVYIQVF